MEKPQSVKHFADIGGPTGLEEGAMLRGGSEVSLGTLIVLSPMSLAYLRKQI